MIDYQQYCQIKNYHDNRQLTAPQIARGLQLDERTVAPWLTAERFQPRQAAARPSKLDPYKKQVVRWLESHPYTAAQVFLRLREAGYTGGITVVKDYVRKIRPPRTPAFLTLAFAPGECAQVDWGRFGSIAVGHTRRRLSFFVMVLCYSRMLYVKFTVSETMEHFLACHANAFAFFGGVPERVMVDNLRSAVLQHALGQAPVLNPRYQDFANHFGFTVRPCGVGQPPTKSNRLIYNIFTPALTEGTQDVTQDQQTSRWQQKTAIKSIRRQMVTTATRACGSGAWRSLRMVRRDRKEQFSSTGKNNCRLTDRRRHPFVGQHLDPPPSIR